MKYALILYSIICLSFSIFSFLFIDSNLQYYRFFYSGFFSDHRGAVSLFYIIFLILFYSFYIYFTNRAEKNSLTIQEVKKLVIITTVCLFFSYPAILSFDIFNYIITSKVAFGYFENPYIVMPAEFLKDPLLNFVHASNKTALYGPFWILLTGIPYVISFGNFITNLLGLKLLCVIFYLLTTWLIWRLTKSIKSVIFFCLNPLVIIETLVSGHNDIVMMFLALFSYYLIFKRKFIAGILILLLSILIKFSTLFLTPIVVYLLWNSYRNKEVHKNNIYLISSFLMLLVFLYAPFREEIYPWYGIWFITFVALLNKNSKVKNIVILFSASLMLRYIPFMYLGTYFGLTPLFKQFVTILPALFLSAYYLIRKKYV